ncbi:MAG TPA: zinc ABC transporter substrate-binding protein [Alphaproteobacteria bacterium]|nr:zinc ABC transporter substrate-binding protein [Alphaproteobacteria bacterium]
MVKNLVIKLLFTLFTGMVLLTNSIYGQTPPNVVISIKPIHSLISFLMQGIKEPQVIVDGFLSEHEYYLKPSDIRKLEQAQIIVWMGNTIDPFMYSYIKNARHTQIIIKVQDIPGLSLFSLRQGGVWDQHDHCQEDDHHADHAEEIDRHELGENHHKTCVYDDEVQETIDGHLWLDPQNAKIIATYISNQLVVIDPKNQSVYARNLDKLKSRLDAIDQAISKNLASYQGKPILVAHDAYQYFEKRYRLSVIGSVTLTPGEALSIKRLHDILDKISAYPQICIFQEPQFNNQKLATILSTPKTNVKIGMLDPIGANIDTGPELYFSLLGNITQAIIDCWHH